MTDLKPTSFKNGVPPQQSNGFFGLEAELIANPSWLVTAVVTYEVEEIVHKEVTDERYPVVKARHIEPLRDPEAIAAALNLRDAAYEARTNEDALDLPKVEDEA